MTRHRSLRQTVLRQLVSLGVIAGVVSCSNPAGPSDETFKVFGPGFETSIQLSFVGDTAKVAAQLSRPGDPLGIPTFVTEQTTWTSSNTGVATISSAGVVTARGAGQATVTGTYQGKSGQVSVSVNLSRVVPVLLWTQTGIANGITATLEGRSIASNGYHVFNLQPGDYELVGRLTPGGGGYAVAFATIRSFLNPPPISDNGVQVSSIRVLAGPSPSLFLPNCEVDFRPTGTVDPNFRIAFTVTQSRTPGVTCPIDK